jgi:DNA-directed RNA polymerase subunit RPC12/RpoP
MVLYQCPECDKSFKNSVELYYHIQNYHLQTPTAKEKKCPRCGGKDVVPSAIFQLGELSKITGRIQRKMIPYYICKDCKKLFRLRQN